MNISVPELTYMLATLSNVKKPSKRLKLALVALEARICLIIEGFQTIEAVVRKEPTK